MRGQGGRPERLNPPVKTLPPKKRRPMRHAIRHSRMISGPRALASFFPIVDSICKPVPFWIAQVAQDLAIQKLDIPIRARHPLLRPPSLFHPPGSRGHAHCPQEERPLPAFGLDEERPRRLSPYFYDPRAHRSQHPDRDRKRKRRKGWGHLGRGRGRNL